MVAEDLPVSGIYAVQKMTFPIQYFFSKCYQIGSFMWIWSYILKKSLMENGSSEISVLVHVFFLLNGIVHFSWAASFDLALF